MNFVNVISKRFYKHSKVYGKYLGILSMLGMGVGCFAIIISISVMNGFENIVHQAVFCSTFFSQHEKGFGTMTFQRLNTNTSCENPRIRKANSVIKK